MSIHFLYHLRRMSKLLVFIIFDFSFSHYFAVRLQNDEQDTFKKIKSFEKNKIKSTPANVLMKQREITKALDKLMNQNGSMFDCLTSLSEAMKEFKLKAIEIVQDGERRMSAVESAVALQINAESEGMQITFRTDCIVTEFFLMKLYIKSFTIYSGVCKMS